MVQPDRLLLGLGCLVMLLLAVAINSVVVVVVVVALCDRQCLLLLDAEFSSADAIVLYCQKTRNIDCSSWIDKIVHMEWILLD